MALATITFDASDYGGIDFDPRRTKVYATNNAADQTIYDTAGNKQYIGSGTGTIGSDGTGSISVPIPAAGFQPATWQTTIHFDVPDRNAPSGRRKVSAGPFTIATSGTLGSKIEEMPILPVYASDVLDRLDALEEATDGTGPELAALSDRLDGVNDHGDVSGALTLNPAKGFHVFDATGPTTVTLGNPPGNSLAFKAITGADDVSVNGLPDLELTDNAWSTFVYYRGAWDLAASGAGGGGSVEPVTDPPTQPGAVTVDPTADGFALSWVASTVAAGYEVQIDGGSWVDSGPDLAHTFTGLASGSSHSGAVRAYNTPGARSSSRAWGPSSALLPGLHEQLLAYNAPLYIRANDGAFEDLSTVERTWNFNWFTDPGGFGGTPVTFDGPPVANVPESMKFNYRSTMRSKDGDFQDFADMTEFTAVMLLSGEYPVPTVQLHDGFTLGANRGTVGNEAMGPDTTIEHLLVWRWTVATGRQFWRDGVLTVFDGYSVPSGPVGVGDSDNRGLWIGATNKSYSAPPDFTRCAPFLFAMPQALTDAEIVALAQAAGTFGNPR